MSPYWRYMKAYITCPICVTKQRLMLIPEIEEVVKSKGIEAYKFDVSGTPGEVFKRDHERLSESSLVIAEVSEPSHGVGILIGLSYSLGLSRILLLKKGRELTKIAYGFPDTFIIEYENEEDLKERLAKELDQFSTTNQID